MREIKFRGWDGRSIFDVSQITFPGGGMWEVQNGRGVSIKAQPHITLMQYTGLKDKNGVEIYEGDIIENVVYGGKYIIRWGNKDSEYAGFTGGLNGKEIGDLLFYSDKKNCEVIGNIYENPDLR